MFTINGTLDDEEAKAEDLYYEKKRNKQPTTKEEEYQEFERQHKKRAKNNYSSLTGATGEVFKTGKMLWNNDMKQMPCYMDSIDNLTGMTSSIVNNAVFCPLWGHKEEYANEEDEQVPVAVL